METKSQASKNFKKINPSVSTRKAYSTFPQKSTKLKWVSSKVINKIFPFSKNSVYGLRSGIQLEKPRLLNLQFNLQFIQVQKTRELIPENIKSCGSADIFRSEIKKWVPETCECRLYKRCFSQVDFLNEQRLVGVHCCLIVFSILIELTKTK